MMMKITRYRVLSVAVASDPRSMTGMLLVGARASGAKVAVIIARHGAYPTMPLHNHCNLCFTIYTFPLGAVHLCSLSGSWSSGA